ncbi:MAG: tetratricopeptide repeat protein [Planctomycetota bacterium]
MGQLLQILGRGLEVETADLIWQWLGQAAEVLANSDPSGAKWLEKIVESTPAKNPVFLQRTLDEYRRLHPRSHYADLAAAAVALNDNRLSDAFELLNLVYSRYPRNVTALYALGHCCERLGREGDAIAFYQDCLKFKNYLRFPRQRLAAIYFKNGQIEKTIREYLLLAAEYPDDLPTLLTLGHLYLAVAQYKHAADTFSTAILIQPDNFAPDIDPIDTLIEAGDFNEAFDQIDNMLEMFPDRPDLLLRRAVVLAAIGQQDEALAGYNHTIAVCPNFLEANIKFGSHHLRIGNSDSAALQFARAALINDHIVDAYLGLATSQKLAGNNSEALVSLSLASAVETNGPLLVAEAARLHFHLSADRADAESQSIVHILNAHNNMLRLSPQNPELHYRLGILLMSVGRPTQAIELFKRSFELNPTNASVRNKLAVCLHETDEKALALENLSPASCLEPETLNLHYRVALLYCDKIKFASSLLNLEQWLCETLSATDAAVNISLVLQNLGLIDSASLICDNLHQTACCRPD